MRGQYSGKPGTALWPKGYPCVTGAFFLQRYQAAYAAEWEHFVAVLRGDVQPECGGEEGERALYLADKALESLHSQREISCKF